MREQNKAILQETINKFLESEEYSDINATIENNKGEDSTPLIKVGEIRRNLNFCIDIMADYIKRIDVDLELKHHFGIDDESRSLHKINQDIPYFYIDHEEISRNAGINLLASLDENCRIIEDENNDCFEMIKQEVCNRCNKLLSYTYHIFDNKITLSPDTERCTHIHPKSQSIELEICSGKILVANDFRSIFPEEISNISNEYIQEHTDGYGSLDTARGRELNTEFWSQLGLMHFAVGNCSPSFYWSQENNKLTFKGRSEEELKTEDIIEQYKGTVCTDLWAIQAIDYNNFAHFCEEKGLDPNKTIKKLDAVVVDVPKGAYKATTYWEKDVILDNGAQLYATIELMP